MRGHPPEHRPRFPDVAKHNGGEDPARFLCADMDVIPLIRGISDLGRCNAWIQVAREIGAPQRVQRALERRRDFILQQTPARAEV